jgi:thiamine monophosphate synthase
MDELLNLGAKNIALIRGILETKDIKAQSAAFKKKLEQRSILYGYKDKR